MNVEIGAEAALFPEKEYMSRIFVALWFTRLLLLPIICEMISMGTGKMMVLLFSAEMLSTTTTTEGINVTI
jgi:hypothetical protein